MFVITACDQQMKAESTDVSEPAKAEIKKDGDKLTWDIEIPENTKGEVMLPCYGQRFSASVNGKLMDIKPTESNFAFLGELGSGKYHIELTTF